MLKTTPFHGIATEVYRLSVSQDGPPKAPQLPSIQALIIPGNPGGFPSMLVYSISTQHAAAAV